MNRSLATPGWRPVTATLALVALLGLARAQEQAGDTTPKGAGQQPGETAPKGTQKQPPDATPEKAQELPEPRPVEGDTDGSAAGVVPAGGDYAGEWAPGVPGPGPVLHPGAYPDPVDPWAELVYRSAPGVGYAHGFTTLGGFAPLNIDQNVVIFADLRGLLDDEALLGANAGGGVRIYIPELDRVFGLNAYYDVRQIQEGNFHEHVFQQVGFGFEALGRYVDLRGNVYVPVDKDQRIDAVVAGTNAVFFSTHIGLDETAFAQASMTGWDLEVGAAVPYLDRFGVKAYVGGYNYQVEESPQAWGVRGRLEADFKNFFASASVSNDRLFGTTGVVSVGFRLGAAISRTIPDAPTQYARLDDRVERNETVTVVSQALRQRQLLINPQTGQPFVVIHVNNAAPAGGNGSVEQPLNQLAPAPGLGGPNAIILVAPGNGSVFGYNQGVSLLQGQRLLSTSVPHTITSDQGTFALPGFVPGPLPVLTAPPGQPVVVLANNNEVSGFTITRFNVNPADVGIQGVGVSGYNLNSNNITMQGSAGILLSGGFAGGGALGSGTITNNTFSGNGTGLVIASGDAGTPTVVVMGNSFLGNFDGIAAAADGTGSLTLFAQRNAFSGNAGDGLTLTAMGNATVDGYVQDSLALTGNGTGLLLNSRGSATLNSIVSGNRIDGNVNDGVAVAGVANSTANVTVSDNPSLSGNGGNGVRSFADITANVTTNVTRNGAINNNGAAGVDYIGQGSGHVSGTVSKNNSIDGNGVGVEAGGRDQSVVGVTVAQNQSIQHNTGNGVQATSLASSNVTAVVSDNDAVNGNGLSGVAYRALGISALTGVVSGNTVDANHGAGVVVAAGVAGGTDTAVANLSVLDNKDISNNGGPGVDAVAAAETRVGLAVANNKAITNNGGSGVRVVSQDTADLTSVVSGNGPITGNAGDGVTVRSGSAGGTDTSVASVYVLHNTSLSGNGGSGVQATGNGATKVGVVVADNGPISGNGGSGVSLGAFNTSTLNALVTGNGAINANKGDGVTVVGGTAGNSDTATVNVSVTQNKSLSGNAGNGVGVAANAGTTVGVSVANNGAIDGNGLDGVRMEAMDSARLTGVVSGNGSIDGNGGRGVGVSGSGTSIVAVTVSSNQSIDGNTNGVRVTSDDSSNVSAVITNNAMINGNGVGVSFLAADTSTLTALVSGNTICFNKTIGVQADATDQAKLSVTISGNPKICNNPTDDIAVTASGTATPGPQVAAYILNNPLISNSNTGALVEIPSGFGRIDLIASGNTFTNNSAYGLDVENHGTGGTASAIFASVTNNTFTNNGVGMNFLAANNSFLSATVTGNTVTNNKTVGIQGTATDLATMNLTISGNPSISGNGSQDILISASGTTLPGPHITASILNNPNISGSNTGALVEIPSGFGRIDLTASGNTFQNNTAYGMDIENHGTGVGSIIDATVTSNTFSNNPVHDFQFLALGATQNCLDLKNNVATTNGYFLDGVPATALDVVLPPPQTDNVGPVTGTYTLVPVCPF